MSRDHPATGPACKSDKSDGRRAAGEEEGWADKEEEERYASGKAGDPDGYAEGKAEAAGGYAAEPAAG